MSLVKLKKFNCSMKKIASFKVFRNVFFTFLIFYPATNFLCQKDIQNFQSPLTKCWQTNDLSINSFASDNESTIYVNNNSEVIRIDNNTGKEIWKTSIGVKYDSLLMLQSNEINLISVDTQTKSESMENVYLKILDTETGIVKENTNIGQLSKKLNLEKLSEVLIPNESVNIDRLKVTLKSLETFNNLSDNSILKISVEDEKNIFITDGQTIQNLYSTNDEMIKSPDKKTTDHKITTIAVVNNNLFWGEETGNVFQKNLQNGVTIKLLRTGGRISLIKKNGADLLIASNDNFLYLYSTDRKKVSWKKRLSGRVIINPQIKKNFVVVTTNAVSELLFVNLENGKNFNQITLPENTFIKNFQILDGSVIILTNSNLVKFAENC